MREATKEENITVKTGKYKKHKQETIQRNATIRTLKNITDTRRQIKKRKDNTQQNHKRKQKEAT